MYYYADCAYIGGCFDSGLHNTLEPSVYGIPITFYGNDYEKYNEAVDLIKLGTAVNVANSEELLDVFDTFLGNNYPINEVKEKLNTYFESNANVTAKVLAAINI